MGNRPMSERSHIFPNQVPVGAPLVGEERDDMTQFQYQHLEHSLDAFAYSVKSKQFSRCYRKFKASIMMQAFLDFSHPNPPTKAQIAMAWEDVQMAFNGFGDTALHGIILSMWSGLKEKEQKRFLAAIKRGVHQAEKETASDHPRRYVRKFRTAPVVNPDDGYELPTVTPVSGVKMRDWAIDEGFDVEDYGQLMALEEWAEREANKPQRPILTLVKDSSEKDPPRSKKQKPTLRLV